MLQKYIGLTRQIILFAYGMAHTQDLGKWGEMQAIEWLRAKGISILVCNWRYGRYEMDIVAKDASRLIFVEVKTRRNDKYEGPEETVSKAQQKRLLDSGMAYAESIHHEGPVRFDIISIVQLSYGKKLLHIPDAFFPLG
jgi:putative endonuclease